MGGRRKAARTAGFSRGGTKEETTLKLHDHCETFGSTLMIYFFMEGWGGGTRAKNTRQALSCSPRDFIIIFFSPQTSEVSDFGPLMD